MSEADNGTGGGLGAAVEQIAAALEQAKVREEQAREVVHTASEERRRLTTALRALAPEHAAIPETKPGPKQRNDRASVPYGAARNMMPENLQAVWAFVQAQGDEAFTVPEAVEGIEGVSHEPVRRGLHMLREGQAIRRAGKGGKTGNADLFRLLDIEAGERVLADNAEAYDGPVRAVTDGS